MATLEKVAPSNASHPIRRASWRKGVEIKPVGPGKCVIYSASAPRNLPYAFSYDDFIADDWELGTGLPFDEREGPHG